MRDEEIRKEGKNWGNSKGNGISFAPPLDLDSTPLCFFSVAYAGQSIIALLVLAD
jgi:hypothetical protein